MDDQGWIRFMVWVDLITLLFVVIGALNWGIVGLFGVNPVTMLFGKWEVVVYVLVGVSALIHVFNRNYYLPFLGHTAIPCGGLLERVPKDANKSVTVNVGKPGANVIYWAAEEGRSVQPNPWVAYGENSNSGVAKADASGKAVLKFRAPAQYKVAAGMKTLRPHVHYRICMAPGLMSEVRTVYV